MSTRDKAFCILCALILENSLHHLGERKYPRKLIFIWDTGTSYGLTPFRSNFINDVKCNILVNDVTSINRVIDIGNTLQKCINSNGKEVLILCVSYYLTKNYFKLLSSQTYYNMHSGYSDVYEFQVSMYLNDN